MLRLHSFRGEFLDETLGQMQLGRLSVLRQCVCSTQFDAVGVGRISR